ncbi:MAG TPA: hypothetical protein VK686_22550 [Bryobacteraceae bacterium]|nr:hypothetical protein [Bryobacteraceae bacterium]
MRTDDPRHGFPHGRARGLAPAKSLACVTANREARIDRWAAHLRKSLDMNLIHRLASERLN